MNTDPTVLGPRSSVLVPPHNEHSVTVLLLVCWLAHLLAYLWAVPPWQHYDEPTHFEYALLIRDLGRLPYEDEQLPTLRRAIATAMLDAGFYDRPDRPLPRPDLDSAMFTLGISQHRVPPSYYALVALATLPVRHLPITTQLYIARLVSVVLALLLFGAAYTLLRLLVPHDWPLRCWALALLVFQPAFADNMTAVNADALANLVAVVLLAAGVWLLQRPSWPRLLLMLLVGLLALAVKRTLIPLMLLVPFALLLAAPARVRRAFAFAGVGLVAVALCVLLLLPWPLASWSGKGAVSTQAPFAGRAAFALPHIPADGRGQLRQEVPPILVERVAGRYVTLAAWMRGDRPGLQATTPALQIGSEIVSRSLPLDTSWQLVAITARIPPDAPAVAVLLPGPLDEGVAFYDGLALTEGTGNAPPDPYAPDSSLPAGLLAPEPAANLLRNSGAERRVLPLPDALRLLSGRLLDEGGFAEARATLSDPAWIAAVYPRQLLLLFVSAWGVFGWGEVAVPVGWFVPLGIVTLAGLFGAARFTLRATRGGQICGERWLLRAWWLCLGAAAIGWNFALLRVHSQPFPGVMFWSFGRYTFVALVPALLILTVGLRAVFPHDLRQQGMAGVIAFVAIFALAALFGTVLPYYAGR